MKKYLYFSFFICLIQCFVPLCRAQDSEQIEVGSSKEQPIFVNNKASNLWTLTDKYEPVDAQWLKRNKKYEQHPDAGFIAPDRPAGRVIEVFDKRTESTRFFVNAEDTATVYSQGALGALHYKVNNQWLSIDHRLNQTSKYTYEALRQPIPVGFIADKKQAYIQTEAGKVVFNRWTLYGVKDKLKKKLLDADWSNITVGDDGVKVVDIFPGIDAEMVVSRGSIKTNFIIKNWSSGEFDELLLADHYDSGVAPLKFWFEGAPVVKGQLVGDLVLKKGKNPLLEIGKAFMYAESDPAQTVDLAYEIDLQELNIRLKRDEVENLLKQGVVIVDPLVAGASGFLNATFPLNSFRTQDNAACDNYTFNEGCSYSWTVPVPANIEVINTTHTNNLTVVAPCTRDKMAFRIALGDNRDCGHGIVWFTEGKPATPGNVGGVPNVIDNYNPCLEVKCENYDLKVSLGILRACMGPTGCEASCVRGTGPFIMTITGRTIEYVAMNSSLDLSQEICPKSAVTLTPRGNYGVKPYTYLWNDGSKEHERTFHPEKNTVYTVDIIDACQRKVSGSMDVKVKQPAQTPKSVIQSSQTAMGCPGQDISWQSAISAPGNYTYQWMVNGNAANGATHEQWNASNLKNGDMVSLSTTVKEVCFDDYQIQSNEMKVSIYDLPVQQERTELRSCDSLVYEGVTYYESEDIEQMILSNAGCDSLRRVVSIVIEKFDIRLLSVTPVEVFEGEFIHLKAEANVPDFTVNRWEPGFLFNSSPAAIEQRIKGTQSQTFIVYASSAGNCTDSDTLRVTVNSASNLMLMPTAFSPNGDHINDVWEPLRLNDFPEGEIFIYNRWGQCIYHTQDYSVPWDGMYNGSKIPAGVYSYRLVIPGRKDVMGFVTVIY